LFTSVVHAQDEAGNTLLHTAVSGAADQPADYVAALLEAGVPVNAANKEHDTALHLAARQGHVEVRPFTFPGSDDAKQPSTGTVDDHSRPSTCSHSVAAQGAGEAASGTASLSQ
jgi:ankyrin repeat protein